jgi:acyl carrier protein
MFARGLYAAGRKGSSMDPQLILDKMKTYFAGKLSEEELAAFAEQAPRNILKESLDVVDFLVYLEDELGREIDINELGDPILNKNFGELAEEVSRMLGPAAA